MFEDVKSCCVDSNVDVVEIPQSPHRDIEFKFVVSTAMTGDGELDSSHNRYFTFYVSQQLCRQFFR